MPYKQIGKYRDNKISPLLYPSVIYKVAKEFNEAYVLVEVNVSEQVAEILYNEYEYENIVFVNRTTSGSSTSPKRFSVRQDKPRFLAEPSTSSIFE